MKEQQHIPMGGVEELRKKYCSLLEPEEEFRILDLGFGTGTLSLVAINHIRESFGNKKIVIYGVDNDKYLLDYLDKQKQEKIFEGQEKILQSLAKNRVFEAKDLKIRLLDGDLKQTIDKLPNGFNYVFYDLFGPTDQEHLWDEDIFKRLKKKLNEGSKLATHTASTDVRINLVRAGFEAYDGPEIWKGFNCTHATLLE